MKNHIVLWLSICIGILSCGPEKGEKKNKVWFSGTINTYNNQPVENAEVTINGLRIKSIEKNQFNESVDSTGRYVLTIRKEGFGFISKVYYGSVTNEIYVMAPATVITVEASQPIVVSDNQSVNCPGSALQRIKWADHRFNSIPRVLDIEGNLIDFGFPSAALEAAFSALTAPPICNPGISISIQANGLVNANGPVTGKVKVSLNTIDIYSPDGMPGDFSYQRGNESGYMISMGAGIIEITDEKGNPCQIAKEANAELIIPIDPLQLKFSKQLSDSISLVVYDEDTGVWKHDGKAILNKDRNAYVAKLKHLSAFNMDILKSTPACIRFKQEVPKTYDTYRLSMLAVGSDDELIVPIGTPTPKVIEPGDCDQGDGTGYHVMYNLPNNTSDVCVIYYEDGTEKPLGIYILPTGNDYTERPKPTCPYNDDNCTDLTIFTNDSSLVLAANHTPTVGVRLRWLYDQSAGSFTYSIFKADASGSKVDINTSTPEIDPIYTVAVTSSDDPRVPSTLKTHVEASNLSTGDYCIAEAVVPVVGTVVSNVIQIN